MSTGLAHWPNKTQAAAEIGCSDKTIERLSASGELETRHRNRPGKRPEAVYSPEDVARHAAARQLPTSPPPPAQPEQEPQPPALYSLRRSTELQAPPDARRATPSAELPAAAAIAAMLAQIATQAHQEPPLFVDTAGASAATGLSKRYITAARLSEQLPAIKDGRVWRYRRSDLDKL